MITTAGERLSIQFNAFGPEEYDRFLRCKRLPESTLDYDYATDTYTIGTHSRYASLLGVKDAKALSSDLLPFPDWHFQHAVEITKLALRAKSFACWADCGLGKTNIELEFGRQVNHITGGRTLILTLPEVALQTVEECDKFYGKDLPIVFLETKADMIRWCDKGDNVYKLAVTNYEKMNPDKETGQVISEMKNLAGLIVDENRLKGGGGKQKWAIIKSSRGVPYKMTATATPAPNDYIEFASQASFLERMRSENEIIWTFFAKDKVTGEWTVKPHARQAFFEWMCAWSIYVKDPRAYGWAFDVPPPPDPEIIKHQIDILPEQIAAAREFDGSQTAQASLLPSQSQGMVARGKLSQIAKGFVYKGKGKDREIVRIPSLKPAYIQKLIRGELADNLQTLVWTVFDEESEILAEPLYAEGLISNSDLLGYGMNLQMAGSMIFSGWNDSFEDWYQTVRRAVRYFQTRAVRVHIPYIHELEFQMLENVFRKEANHFEAVTIMEQCYIDAMKRMEIL